jgi:filamentous hemagglutinin family protein
VATLSSAFMVVCATIGSIVKCPSKRAIGRCSLLMKSPFFFAKNRKVRVWVQILLVGAMWRLIVLPPALYANPQGEVVVGGAAAFNRPDAATLIVNQQTDRAVINWNSFSIANGELTKFVQPNSSSAVLNRVVTANPSAIYGTLQANGNVYLINPGGVLVGAGGVVNTASFVASTHDINTEEFMNGGQLNFNGNSDASVINEGNITAREGDVFLIAKEVKNEGQLMAKDGTVGMVSGTEVSLQAVGQGNFKVRLMAAETDPTSPRTSQGEGGASKGSAEIVNEGVIQAANAVLEAKGSYLPMAIKNTGVIEATGLVENGDGSVSLIGGEGDILNTGVVAALQRSLDGQRETGGSIMMTAKNVTSDLGSVITASGKDGGGTVELRSGYTTELRGEISVVGTSESAKGGQVQLLGERVGLLDQAKVDASGGAGGGEVLVGGDYLGKNPNVPNANAVVLAPDGKILADATSNGDGGKVILWSDEYTGFYGNISARGGMFTGDGGFVETSSKINLQAFGLGNVGSVSGTPGNWLLDPADVTIVAAGGSGMSNQGPNPGGIGATTPTGNIYYPIVNSATISAGTIAGLLGSGNVAVTTDNTDPSVAATLTQAGNITIDTGATISWTSGNTLRLRADAGIVINGTISGSDNGVLELFSSGAGAATQGPTGVISVGSLLLNGLGNGTLLNGANVVDSIAGRGLSGVVSFRDTGGFNGATGLIISTVTAGDVTGYTSATSDSTTIGATTAVGIISAGTVNLTSTGPITQTAKIDMSGGNFCAVTLSGTVIQVGGVNIGTSIGADILLDNTENQVSSLNLATLNSAGDLANAANIKFTEFQDFTIDDFGSVVTAGGLVPLDGVGAPAGGIITGRAITIVNPVTGAADVFGGSIVLTGGADGTTRVGLITQTPTGSIIGSNLGLLGDYNYDFTDSSDNNITTLAAFLEDAADLDYTDSDGFQVFFVNFMRDTPTAVMIPGIRLEGFGTDGTDQYETGDLNLTTLSGVEFNGIQLTSTGDVITPNGTVTARTITPDNQYSLLPSFTGVLAPGHIEASGNVTLTVEDGDGSGITTTEANRFTLQEGIHLFAGMGPELTNFGNSGNAIIQADNMIIGSDTRPDLAMHGLIMTGNVNEAGTVPFATGTFFRPFTNDRQAYIVTTKADYDVTPDPGQLQLTQAELRRVNSNRLQVRSSFTDSSDPAVDVRTPLNLYGLYDTVEISGIFPTNPGINRLELIAGGASDATTSTFSNVQVSADISSDVNQLPMDIFLSASQLDDLTPGNNQTSGGKVFVNGGLRSYGGQIGIQGQNVEISAAISANNPRYTDGLGLVAIFPGRGPSLANGGAGLVTPILLGTKDTTSASDDILGILRSELALITAGTVQIGDVELRPAVLSPVNPFTGSSIVGTNPLFKNDIQSLDAGSITVTDLIAGLSCNTLALVTSGDRFNPTDPALSQAAQAGLQVPGLFVVGNPFSATTDYILGGAYNEIDNLAVVLGLATATGAASGDLLLVNQKGLVGGNGGEVARIQQQWDQGYVRTTTAPFLSTGVGLVVARALSITAAGSVSIYETVPTGVTGLGYIGHVASNPNGVANGSNGYAQVGNQIGLMGDITSGLGINVVGSAPGETGPNSVWAAAARGLSVNSIVNEFNPGLPAVFAESGILTGGGQVTLEGNAIEIADTVVRLATAAGDFSANTITIDTTAAQDTSSPEATAATAVAPSGARVVIRPATGQNGFQDRLGSGAFDPDFENSPLAGAPVEMNLGTTSIGAGTTFLNASLGTVFIGNAALAGTAIRGSVLEIGRNTDPATATGKFTITANIGAAGNEMSTLLGEVHLISGGAVEDAGMIISGGAGPFTITTNLNNTAGNGGLAVEALGAIALQGDVASFAADAGANNNVRFIDTLGGVSIGVVDSVSGILANTFYLQVSDPIIPVNGRIGQASGATIEAPTGGISVTATGAIRLDQENDFNLVAASSPGNEVYLRSAGPMSVSAIAAGQPGGRPAGVTGITGSNVTLVAGGDLTQSDLSPINATVSFLATVLDGSDIFLESTQNSFGTTTPIFGALTTAGTLGSVRNLSIVSGGALELGSAGMLTVDLTSAGSGWTTAPTLTVSSGSVAAVMGLQTVAVTSGGNGYLSAPLVTLSDSGGTGTGATAVAVVDLNPLSVTYGQVTSINVINAGTGYTGPVSVSLSGGGATQQATVGTRTLVLQRINVVNPGSDYTTAPTISGLSANGASATVTIGGTGGYVASGSTTVLGGITGDLEITTAAGGITNGSGLSVAGTTTLADNSGLGLGIILGSPNNNLQGVLTITENGVGPVTVVNNNGLILGNITVGTGALNMTAYSIGITQSAAGNAIVTGGSASFSAVNTSGTANGPVILNNSLNSFGGSVAATGTRVVIRDSTALELGNIIATTSLTATAGVGDITQFVGTTIGNSTYTTGSAAFAAASGQNITVGNVGNYFGSTVSFAALSGTLASVSVRDTTALDLGALTLGAGGNLNVTGAGITQSGALVVPGTITLAGDAANNITLNNADNNFGTVVITSGNNVTLRDSGGVILSGPSFISGNFSLTAGGNITDANVTSLTVTGLATFNAGSFGITLGDDPFDTTNFGSLNLTGGTVTVTQDSAMVLAGVSANALDLTATSGITQTGAVIVATGSTFNASDLDANIILDNSGNTFNGAVSFAGAGGLANVTLVDTTAVDLQALTLSGNLSITSGGAVTDSGVLKIVGTTTISAVGQNITLDSANEFTGAVSLTGANVAVTNVDLAGLILGTTTATGTFDATATTGNITQSGAINVTGASTFTGDSGFSISLDQSANVLTGLVEFVASTGILNNVTLVDTTAFQIQDGLILGGDFVLTAAGITQGAGLLDGMTIGGTTTLNGGTGAIVLTNSGNSYLGTVTITGGASADMFIALADKANLGAVATRGTFTLQTDSGTDFNIANGGSLEFDVDDATLASFNVGTFAPIATGGGSLNLGALTSYPGIGGISLTTLGGGDINALGAINLNTLQFNSSGAVTFSAVNGIQNLGSMTVAVGGVTLQNARGLNLTGTATMPGRLSLEVAGQFYNLTGQSQPLGGVADGSVIKSLSLMGGLPNQVSGLAGFSYRYDGVMPTSGNVMSYAVSPLTMFAPGGTTIAGVDLGGTQTGGGQFNTFLTGSDNLNWMISDFGRFDMPTVKPSGMDYILYPQRVEPETKTLPAATLGQLERELGRPPTLEEIQAREVAVREAAMVRSGAILERSSFDAVEDEVDKQESAEVPAQVIDGGKPQAGGPSVAPNPLSGGAMEGFEPQADARRQRSEDGMQKAGVGSRPSFAPSPASSGGASQGFGSQARKTQSVRQGSNGPILRSGPIRSVAQLRPAEPSQSGNISEASAQALKLDAKSVIEQERASAEVGIAPPIASGR